MKNNELYDRLKSKNDKPVNEAVTIEPLGSYETIISAVNYALTQSEAIEELIDGIKEEMMECDMGKTEAMPVPMIYPFLIATYPTFCLFELGPKTYKCTYGYDNSTREVSLGMPVKVILDAIIAEKPETEDD